MKYNNKIISCYTAIIILLVTPLFSISQILWNDQSEMLEQLRKSKPDTGRVNLFLKLSHTYLDKSDNHRYNPDSALYFANEAMYLSQELQYEPGINESTHAKAIFYFKTGDILQGKKLYRTIIDIINKPGNEETEAGLWQELAMLIPSRDSTGITRLYCLNRTRSLYKQTGNQEKEIETLKSIADMHLVQGRLHLAETMLLDVLQRYKAIGYANLHYTYDLLSGTYRNKGDFSRAIFYGLKTIESMELTHDSSSATVFYSRLANMYRELGQPEKSVEWYWKVFRTRTNTNPINLYMFRDAGFLARELIKLKKEKEALEFMLDISAKNKPIGVHAEASLFGSLAFCYHAIKDDQQAEKYYLKLANLTGQLQKNNEVRTDVHYELGRYFIRKGDYRVAAENLQNALNAAEGINSPSDNKDIYLLLYRADSGMGNWRSASHHLHRLKQLNDSIFNETKIWQIEELEVQYETANKQKDIEFLNNQNKLQDIRVEQANRSKNITLAGVVLLLIIAGLVFNRYLIKQRSNRKLEAHQKELDQKNMFLETMNAEQDKLLKEKEWLIREVHHRVKNNLQMVTSLLNSQSIYLEGNAAILAIKDSLRRMQAMSLIHQKLYQDQNISVIGMTAYIDELVRYLQESFDTGHRIVFEQTIDLINLDVSQAIPLGLIINESIVNSIKYAFPEEHKQGIVSIVLQHDGNDYLLLKISDNGIGLPPGTDTREHNSLGLDLMHGLTRQLNGTFRIESNKGVHITVRFLSLNK